MTSRERLIKALNFEEADRVPIDLGGFQTGIHKLAYIDLLNYLNKKEEIRILDPVQQLVVPSEDVLERFHADVRYITAHAPDSFKGEIKKNQRNGRLWHDLKDEFGVVWSMPDDQQLYMDISHHPLADATIKDIEKYPFPKGDDQSRFTGVRDNALKIINETPYALSTGICGVVYETCWYMRGLERWFMDMIDNPKLCEALLDQTSKYWIDFFNVYMKEIGDLIDVVMIGDDLAAQHGVLFSPKFYREVVKPRQKKVVQHLRSLTNAKIWYHTCGACSEYIDDLLDNGIDILNPVQISAKNMDPAELKRRYGTKLVFWGGGIDSQQILPRESPDVIRKHVKKNIEIFKPGGGYVFNNVHNIQCSVPPENIVALFDAAYEYGFY